MTDTIPQPSHPPVRDEIMKFYSDLLNKQFNFNYWEAQKVYHELGNEPGVYPDVCLMLFELIEQYKPKRIVEIGSGFSTLILSLAAEKNNAKFHSYDQDNKWLQLTSKLLDTYNRQNCYLGPFDNKTDNNLITDASFVFVDFMDREYMLSKHADWFSNVDIFVMDDCALPPHSQGLLYEFMTKSKRYNFICYNGSGRTDRIEFISFKKLEPEVDYFIGQKMGYL